MEHSRNESKSEMVPPPTNLVPKKADNRLPVATKQLGSRGQSITLLTNHFKVSVSNTGAFFYQYDVAIKYEDGSPVEAKGVGRSILDKVQETYRLQLDSKKFAYDGEKTLFTVGSLSQNRHEFTVILDDVSSSRSIGSGSSGPDECDRKRLRCHPRLKTYKVTISYVRRIAMQAVVYALSGQDSEEFQEAVRVLDIILRQNAAQKGCLLVRQSFFRSEPRNFVDIGGGVVGCRGYHSSFRATQGGLSLNMDVSTTMIVKPGPVADFLLYNQGVRDLSQINWAKAKKVLKNLRIKCPTSNKEFKISGLSDLKCSEQTFLFKERRDGDGTSEAKEVEITVYNYYAQHRNIKLKYSGDFPCLNVGKPKKPTYIPIELCTLVSLQRYTKALSNLQRASLVEKSRQKPQERMSTLRQALASSNYGADSLLQASGISISNDFTRIQGRILAPPKLKVGNREDLFPRNGRWNFNNKKFYQTETPAIWVAVNFSSGCRVEDLCNRLVRCAEMKGMAIGKQAGIFDEDQQYRHCPAPTRVDKMMEILRASIRKKPQFLLCVLPERKNSELYGPWKKKTLSDIGIVTQCVAPTKVNDQYLTNLLLKINAKLGGINSLLSMEHPTPTPKSRVLSVPTFILGMDVSHGSPGRDVPSIAAVVGSVKWPLISQYKAVVRSQPPKSEMIDSLFKKEGEDHGIFMELLKDFYITSHMKPEQIIIFRDGVSESQFNQVLNIELGQIIQACKFKDESWKPKFMVVVAQKKHHTKFFLPTSPENVPPGTVIDNGVCHTRNNDFYMCAHAGMIGTTRPTHYHVLHDELCYSPDDLQEFVHSLSYVYQRSTTAISLVAPICYAHLAAAQVSQFVKMDEGSDQASNPSGGVGVVPDLPRLNDGVKNSMFFC